VARVSLRSSFRTQHVVDADAHEGPVYDAATGALYFTSVSVARADGSREVAIRRVMLDGLRAVGVETVVAEANAANGMALDARGRLVVCEQGGPARAAAISRIDAATGEREVLVDAFLGLPLNSPNDVAVAPDGALWFTDPSYGHLQGFRPAPRLGDQVYRHDPANGETTVVAHGFDKPNGVALTAAGDRLYVGDNGAPEEIRAYDVRDGRHLDGGRVLVASLPGGPDGLKTDAAGRVYASWAGGVRVFAPDGALLGAIELPGAVNFTWGGATGDVLFITTDAAVWAAVPIPTQQGA
jgi:gluconolactonase